MSLNIEYIGKYFLKVLALIGIFIYLYIPIENIYQGKVALSILLFVSVLLIYRARKFKPLSIMFFYWFTYSFVLIDYYWNGVDISGGYNHFDQIILYNETLRVHLLFVLCVYFLFPDIKFPIYLKDRINGLNNNFFFYLTLLFMMFILLFGTSGQNIWSSGGYGKFDPENLGGTSIFEYFVVLVPLLFLFSTKNKFQRYVFWMVIFLYCFKSLGLGYRNQIIQVCLVCFCLLDNPRIKYRHIFLASIIPVYLLLIFGAIRQNPLVLLSNDINDILFLPFEDIFNALGNQSDVYYSTVRMYGFLDIGIIDDVQRYLAAFYNFFALFVPYSYLPELANLAAYKKDQYGAGGGGLISMYWFVFGGYFGVFTIAAYIAFIFRKLITSHNIFFIIYMILVLSTYLRWFAYNQISLFKICSYGVFFYLILLLLRNVVKTVNLRA